MKKKIKKFIGKNFVRNILVVLTGTAFAQVITLSFAPIITRLYGPEAFGIYGIFMTMIAIISPISALTYPVAIVLPKKDEEAKKIVYLSVYLASILALVTTITLFFFKDSISSMLQIEAIAPFLYLLPLIIIFSTWLHIVKQWLIRKKQFKITAKAAVFNAFAVNSLKTVIGLLNPVAGVLVIIATFANGINAFLLTYGISKKAFFNISNIKKSRPRIRGVWLIAKEYKDFPLYRAPQTFVNALSQSLPIILLATFFGPISAGFYSLSRSVLATPISLIGQSVSDVFYPRIVEAEKNGSGLTILILKTTMALFAIGIIPFGTVILWGPQIFEFVFGEEWKNAGVYASWLSFGFFFGLVNRPSISSIPVLKIQEKYLIYEVVSAVTRGGSLFFIFYLFQNDVYAIAAFSITTVLLNILLITYVLWQARKSDNRSISNTY